MATIIIVVVVVVVVNIGYAAFTRFIMRLL